MFVEQRLRRHEEAWRAVPALRRAEIGERFLKRMQAPVGGEPFDGRHAPPVAFHAQDQARQHRLVVQEHGAGAAFAQLASVLGAAQIQVFTQDLEQRLVRRERDLGSLAVDEQFDRRVGWWHRHEG
jgi:hypothetical protein